jgi:hypothetical protein
LAQLQEYFSKPISVSMTGEVQQFQRKCAVMFELMASLLRVTIKQETAKRICEMLMLLRCKITTDCGIHFFGKSDRNYEPRNESSSVVRIVGIRFESNDDRPRFQAAGKFA